MCTSDTNTSRRSGPNWIPTSCTLPTVEQPVRISEFDELFAAALHTSNRVDPTTVRFILAAGSESRARDLAARESSCCSFFGFSFAPASGGVAMTVTVQPAHVEVLDAFDARADSAAGMPTPVRL